MRCTQCRPLPASSQMCPWAGQPLSWPYSLPCQNEAFAGNQTTVRKTPSRCPLTPPVPHFFLLTSCGKKKKSWWNWPFQPAGGRQWRDGPVRRRRLCHGEPPDPLEPQYFHSHVQIQDLRVKRLADVSCYRWLGKNEQLTSTGLIASLRVSRHLCSGWIHRITKKNSDLMSRCPGVMLPGVKKHYVRPRGISAFLKSWLLLFIFIFPRSSPMQTWSVVVVRS